MSKKSILFVCYGLGVGGIEKCLITLLNKIDKSRYDIDVLPMSAEYDLLPTLKEGVNVLNPFDFVMNTTEYYPFLKENSLNPIKYIKYYIYRLINKYGRKPWKLFTSPKAHYDIAIAYAHIGYVPYYVVDCINADKKYMWHHEGRYVIGDQYKLDIDYFPKYDSIIAVSNDDRDVLLKAFPNLENKIQVLYNVVDREEIKKKSFEKIESDGYSGLRFVTVGRLTSQKGPDILIEVSKKLRKKGIDFRWYWVGDGDLFQHISEVIKENSLENNIVLLGNRTNPYPFIKMCDIYIQPSYYEAYCTTTLEAKVLEKPVIATDVCGMREQFKDKINGILTKVDATDIFNSIIHLINNNGLRNQIIANLREENKKDDDILQSYYDLFG